MGRHNVKVYGASTLITVILASFALTPLTKTLKWWAVVAISMILSFCVFHALKSVVVMKKRNAVSTFMFAVTFGFLAIYWPA
tara:strand:- start:158 stop:403 length:246 start_codon:yes stop_codon:yes gene_type:complete